MREIKFRFRLRLNIDKWGGSKKGDIETFYIGLHDEQNGLTRFPISAHWDIVSCDTYTGLIDTNGDSIYEGDKVNCLDAEGNVVGAPDVIEFKNGAFWLRHRNIPVASWEGELEIMGNIYYQNPELLEVKGGVK